MKLDVTLDGISRQVEVRRRGEGLQVRVDGGAWRAVEQRARGATARDLVLDGTLHRLDVALDGEQAFVLERGQPRRGTVVDPRDHALEMLTGGGEGTLTTAMPGAIVRVEVAEGDTVSEGQVLVVVEAMKMENEFKAPFDGVIASVQVSPGQAVESGATLIVVHAEGQ